MQEQHLYEYAVIRVVPRVEREEFINIGVILFCKRRRFIRMHYHLDNTRLEALWPELDIDALRKNLDSFQAIAHGVKNAGPISVLEMPERFRWLTAVRSSVIQTSRPHPGLCTDLEHCTEKLFLELVD